MPENAEPEHERRSDATPAVGRVEAHPGSDRHDRHAVDLSLLAALPLAQRQVGHLVTVRGQPLAEVPIPALGAADRVREQAVVDQADPHSEARGWQTFRYHRRATRDLLHRRAFIGFDPSRLARLEFLLSTVEQTTRFPKADPEGAGALKVSVVIPCLNEAASIERCVFAAREALRGHGWEGEVIVADNGSDDGSAELARDAGAIVVFEPRRGYGSAYLAGFAAARGDYIVMADADLTYDFADIPRFVERLDEGAELVMGNRMKNIQPGAMPWLHRYVGNPALTGVLNLFFHTGVQGRALRDAGRPALGAAEPRPADDRHGVRVGDGDSRRQGAPRDRGDPDQLPPARGGVEALELPRRVAPPPLPARAQPDLAVHRAGRGHRRSSASSSSATVLLQIDVFGRTWDIHAMVAGALLMIVGTQVLALGLCAHAYGTYFMGERDPWFDGCARASVSSTG